MPTLQQTLTDADPRRRQLAAEGLARLGADGAAATPILVDVARQDPVADVRKAAIAALGATGKQREAVLDALVGLMKDHDAEIRTAAVGALGSFGVRAKAAVAALVEALRDPDPRVREETAETLGSIGPDARDAIPALTEALKDSHARVRREASEALVTIRSPPVEAEKRHDPE